MDERGSASVEFSLVLPLVALMLLAIAQVGVTMGEALSLQHAAREGVRVYAVTADGEAGRAAAVRAGDLERSAAVTARDDSGSAVIEIVAPARIFPGVPAVAVTLRARAVMRFERRA